MKIIKYLFWAVGIIIGSANALAAPRKIYICEKWNNLANVPTTANLNYFENNVLLETSEGSDIYEGLVTNDWKYYSFRFSEKVWEPKFDGYIPQVAYFRNLLGVDLDDVADYNSIYGGDYKLNNIGGVCVAPIHRLETKSLTSKINYLFSVHDSKKECLIRLDLNAGQIILIEPAYAYAIVLEGEEKPTINSWQNYIRGGIGETEDGESMAISPKYVGPHDSLKFRLYNLAEDKFYAPMENSEYLADGCDIKLTNLQEGSGWYEIRNWPGGLLKFDCSNMTLSQIPDQPARAKIEAENLYLRGDHSSWNATREYKLNKIDNKYIGALPAGANLFKIGEFNWGDCVLGWDHNQGYYSEDGSLILQAASGPSSDLFYFSSPLKSDVMVSLDADTYELTLTGDLPNALPEMNHIKDIKSDRASLYGDDFVWLYFDNDDSLPRLNMSEAELKNSSILKLFRNEDGTYSSVCENNLLHKGFRICKTLTDNLEEVEVWSPGESVVTKFGNDNGLGIAQAILSHEKNAGWWEYWFLKNHSYKITLDPAREQISILDLNHTGSSEDAFASSNRNVHKIGENEYLKWDCRAGSSFSLYARKSAYAKGHPLYNGTYALVPVSDVALEFDKNGIARQPFFIREEESDEPTYFTTPSTGDDESIRTIINLDEKIVYFIRKKDSFLIGDYNDMHELTVHNIDEFKGYKLKDRNFGVIADIPKGKFGFTSVDGPNEDFYNPANIQTQIISLDSGAENINIDGEFDEAVANPSWEGGKVIITRSSAMRYDNNLKARVQIGDESQMWIKALNRVEEGVYSGSIHLDTENIHEFPVSLLLNNGNNNINIAVAPIDAIECGGKYFSGETGEWLGHYLLEMDDNIKELEIGLVGTKLPFSLCFDGPTDLNFYLDLNASTLRILSSRSSMGELIYNYDPLGINNIQRSLIDGNGHSFASVWFLYNLNNDGLISIRNSNGKYIIPCVDVASSHNLMEYFDKKGFADFKFDYSDTPVDWKFKNILSNPLLTWTGYDRIAFDFDINNMRVKVHLNSLDSCWHLTYGNVSTKNDEDLFDANFNVEDMESYYENYEATAMRETSQGVFEATMQFDNMDRAAFSIFKGPRYGFFPDWDWDIDLSSLNNGDSLSYPLSPVFYPRTGIQEVKIGDGKAFNVKYDTNENMAYFTRDDELIAKINPSQIDSSDSLKVTSLKGGIRVRASKETDFVIFNLQGIELLRCRVLPGESFISLSPGIYIAASKKVVVK